MKAKSNLVIIVIATFMNACVMPTGQQKEGDPQRFEDIKTISDYVKEYDDACPIESGNSRIWGVVMKDSTIHFKIDLKFDDFIDLDSVKQLMDESQKYDLLGRFLFANDVKNEEFSKAIIRQHYNLQYDFKIMPNDTTVSNIYTHQLYKEMHDRAKNNTAEEIKNYLDYTIKKLNETLPIESDILIQQRCYMYENYITVSHISKTNQGFINIKNSYSPMRNDLRNDLNQPSMSITLGDIARTSDNYGVRYVYYSPEMNDSTVFVFEHFEI